MKYEGMTLEFVRFVDAYKATKTKALIKKITDILEKNIHIEGNHYLYGSGDNKYNIEWGSDFSDDLVKWEKFKKEKGYTEKKLRGRITKALKVLFDDGKPTINVVSDLKLLKKQMGIKSIQAEDITISQVKSWINESRLNDEKYNYANWLDWASDNARNINFSTHIAKLTHSKIKGASSFYFDKKDTNTTYLSTASLHNKEIDVSQSNNALAPIGKFLQLTHNHIKLADKLSENDISDFVQFSENDEQLQKWNIGFFESFTNKNPSSHHLLKQIYFPLEDTYHLINPYVSSSLDQAIFDKIEKIRPYNEIAKVIKNQRYDNKYHSKVDISYPDIAVLKVTASNHSNASPLNGKRSGRRYILTSAPPHWNASLKPPISQKSLFYGEFDRRAWQLAKELQRYLLALQNKKSNKLIRDNVKDSVNKIIDCLFNYVVQVQALENASGWSEQAEKLKESHKLWLDPYRDDADFQLNRKRGDWQDEVCRDYGKWMNSKLNHKKMKFSNIEVSHWAKLLKGRLRELELDLEVSQ